ncbi:MAG: hypothetical protein ACYDCD_07170 [Candidatus Acidiferrales bacterium]
MLLLALEVENIHDDICSPIPQHDVPANHNVFAITRRRRQLTLQTFGDTVNSPA